MNSPQAYPEHLRNYECVLTPDFNLYMDMPAPCRRGTGTEASRWGCTGNGADVGFDFGDCEAVYFKASIKGD